MDAENAYDFEKLSREIVVSQFKGVPDAPDKTADLVKRTLVAAIKGTREAKQAPDEIVRQVVAGSLAGILLIERELPMSAVFILRRTADAAQDVGIDPQEMLTWGLQGIARVMKMVQPPVIVAVQNEIESAFMGAGGIFADLCREMRG